MVLLQRKLLQPWQLWLLRRAAKRLVYDVDDALFQRDSYHHKQPQSAARSRRFAATVRMADMVIVGNEYLWQQVAAYVGPHRVQIIPTCVEPAWYLPAARYRDWAGRSPGVDRPAKHASFAPRDSPPSGCGGQPAAGAGTARDFRSAPQLPGVKVVPCRWSSATEAADLARADIGINWLPDDAWSRGKCGLRVLQYMAAALPVVANPVGMNREMVIHEKTGLLASTPEQWAEAIARLAADPELRRRMGAAGRQAVMRRWSVAAWGPRLAEAMSHVARSHSHHSGDAVGWVPDAKTADSKSAPYA